MKKIRENIDRTLGKSIRCLLPSYWWKKLFHAVVDELEKVDSVLSRKITKVDADLSAEINIVNNVLNRKITDVAQSIDEVAQNLGEKYVFYYDINNELTSEYKEKNIATLNAIKKNGVNDNIYMCYIFMWLDSQPLRVMSKSILTRSGLDQDIYTIHDIPTTFFGRTTKRVEFDWRPNGDIWVNDAPMDEINNIAKGLTDLTEEIIANEEVHAAALNDLNARIQELEERLKNAGL